MALALQEYLADPSKLPDTPGIYLYYGQNKELLYVGKATSLRSRVRSYFRGKRTPRPIEEMIHEVVKIDYRQTDSVLEAIILEALSIRRFHPKYNVLGKDDKSWNYLVLTRDEFSSLKTSREHDLEAMSRAEIKKKYLKIFGPFPGLNAKATLKLLRQLFCFSTCEPGVGRPCFYYEINQCLGVCMGTVTAKEYQELVIRPLSLFLDGKKKQVVKEFEKQMKLASRAQNFETAARLRNQLQSLYRIHDVALLNNSFYTDEGSNDPNAKRLRIEGYDISNLGRTDKVGSMVVFDNSGPVSSQYRKFTIKTVEGQSDVDSLAEVINRRLNHTEWPFPDVFLIDGGRPQVNKVNQVLGERQITIPVVGIAKGPERKRNDFILGTLTPAFIAFVDEHRTLLVKVRDEAHRFAITFNRSKRKIK